MRKVFIAAVLWIGFLGLIFGQSVFLPGPAPGSVVASNPPSWIQDGAHDCYSGTTCAATFASNVTSGDQLGAGVLWLPTTVTLNTITATCTTGNWTLLNNPTTDGVVQKGAQGTSTANTTASCTITANFSGAVAGAKILAVEVSGSSSGADTANTAMQGSYFTTATDNVSSGNVTPSVSNTLLWGWTLGTNGATVFTAGTGFTGHYTFAGDGMSETATMGSPTPVTATFTVSAASHYVVGILPFKP
jgi:hypothetical protein